MELSRITIKSLLKSNKIQNVGHIHPLLRPNLSPLRKKDLRPLQVAIEEAEEAPEVELQEALVEQEAW